MSTVAARSSENSGSKDRNAGSLFRLQERGTSVGLFGWHIRRVERFALVIVPAAAALVLSGVAIGPFVLGK